MLELWQTTSNAESSMRVKIVRLADNVAKQPQRSASETKHVSRFLHLEFCQSFAIQIMCAG
jgi:hypothetical protein